MEVPKFDKKILAGRIRSIREVVYGKNGAAELADQLGLPIRTWLNYEHGVTIPGEILIRYLMLTGVLPLWLYSGEGDRFQRILPDTIINSG